MIFILVILLYVIIYLWEKPDTSNYIEAEASLSGLFARGKYFTTYLVKFDFETEDGNKVSAFADNQVGISFIRKHTLGDKFKIYYNPYNPLRIKFNYTNK